MMSLSEEYHYFSPNREADTGHWGEKWPESTVETGEGNVVHQDNNGGKLPAQPTKQEILPALTGERLRWSFKMPAEQKHSMHI